MPQEILRVTSAGSVDDGKSTILARLLLDTGSVFLDQLGGIDPRKVDATTIADLLDGLESEREQGITIDVAHRFFDSKARRYHLADSPGHEQYTRNMATASSHADAMLLVVDARVGVKPQTRTHFGIARMLGISQFIVAVNKMDLVGFSRKAFEGVKSSLDELFSDQNLFYTVVPVSGLTGDNIVTPSQRMSWSSGHTILNVLEAFTTHETKSPAPVFSIQYVQRIPGGGRRYLGSLSSGELKTGQTLESARYPGKFFTVTGLIHSGVTKDVVVAPGEVSIEIDSEVDLERGDVLAASGNIEYTDQFEADLVWLDEEPGFAGRPFILRIGHSSTKTTITKISELDGSGGKRGAIGKIDANAVARVNFETHQKVSLASFRDFPDLGRFVLVDSGTGATVAGGLVTHTLRRADNLVEHDFEVTASERSALTGRQGMVAWFTGLSGSGKSTLANAVSVELTKRGVPHSILDGDSLRLGLNKDLGFSEADRVENIRRTAEVAKMMADSGLIVLVSLISPYRADRQRAKEIVGQDRFKEIFVDTPLEVCEERDTKGLYKKARQGLIPNFTGIGAPYERPSEPACSILPALDLTLAAKKVLLEIGAEISTAG